MKCEHCQNEFHGRADAKFCSARCRVYSRRGLVHKPNKLAGTEQLIESPPRKPKPAKASRKRKAKPQDEPPTPPVTLAISTITVADPPQPRAVVVARPYEPNCPASLMAGVFGKLPSNRPHDPTKPQT